MKTLLIASAAFATMLVTNVPTADARAGYRGGSVRGGVAHRSVAVRGGRAYRGVAVRGAYRGVAVRARPGYGRVGAIAAGAGVVATGAAAAYYGGCGPYASYDPYSGSCSPY